MRYLVTGGAGFVGSHLVDNLLAHNYQVLVLDNLSTGRIENLKAHESDKNLEFVNGSILDAALVAEVMQGADQCWHLAASLGVQRILERPIGCSWRDHRVANVARRRCNRHGPRRRWPT